MLHHVYLTPGMFGFGRLASYDYFGHIGRGLERRFRDAGQRIELHVVDVAPTASIRRRATTLAEVIDHTAGDEALIHLLGHSTGGLDARVVASPASRFAGAWLPRLKSVTTMNTPHYGTPLASFFATAKGARVLHALSAFTVVGLSLGKRPLGVASALIGLVGRGDRALGIKLRLLDTAVDSLVGLIDDARNPEVRAYLGAIKKDQGAMMQTSPEAMELMVAGFADRPGVAYQSTASMAPTPTVGNWPRTIASPWHAASLGLFTALHGITAGVSDTYPCAAASAGEGETALAAVFGSAPVPNANDGVVPLRSQQWGRLVWAGLGDHLDVLGHYRDDRPADVDAEHPHVDWLTSGSAFNRRQFDALLDAIVKGMLGAA